MGPKRQRVVNMSDEAMCASGSSDEEEVLSMDDDAGSLKDFIASDHDEELHNNNDSSDTDSLFDTTDDDQVQKKAAAANSQKEKRGGGKKTAVQSTVAAAGRQGAAAAKKKGLQAVKPPGDSAYPTNDFSLTITKTKDDVGLDSLDAVAKYLEEHSIKGGVSTEVGQRAFQLHLQGVFRMHWPATKQYVQLLQKIFKSILPAAGKLYKVLLKVFKAAQNFSAMVGYITKDAGIVMIFLFFCDDLLTCSILGQAHYQIRTHNISRAELSFGRRDHDALLTSFDESKKVLNLKNFFNECYKFNMRCMHPAVVPIHYAVLYMIQSGSYILSPDFISTYKKIDLSEAKVLWEMVHKPHDVCLADIMQLLFDPRSYGLKVYLLTLCVVVCLCYCVVVLLCVGLQKILCCWAAPTGS